MARGCDRRVHSRLCTSLLQMPLACWQCQQGGIRGSGSQLPRCRCIFGSTVRLEQPGCAADKERARRELRRERLMAAELARLVGGERRAMARRYRRRREARAQRAERRRQRGRGGGVTVTVTGRKRRRVPTVVQSESEEDDSDSEAGQDDELGTGLEPEIRARGRGRGRNRVESDDESEGEGAGGVKRRCQEGAAEARGSLGWRGGQARVAVV